MIAWVIRAATGLRGFRGVYPVGLAGALYACRLHDLPDGAGSLRSPGRLLVSHRLRHPAGCLILLASDHHRRSAGSVVDGHALRLGDAGEAAKHGCRRAARCRHRTRSLYQAGHGLRLSLHRLPRSGQFRGAECAQGRAWYRGGADRARSVCAQCGVERRARLPDRQAHRSQYRMAVPLRSSAAAHRICRRAVRRVRAHPGRRVVAHRVA